MDPYIRLSTAILSGEVSVPPKIPISSRHWELGVEYLTPCLDCIVGTKKGASLMELN